MVSEHDNRLLPLRRDFGQAWHGFDRTQVAQYLDHLEAQVHQIMAERDSAEARATESARELDSVRQEVESLRARVEELKKPPERIEDLDERMQRTVELAQNRAAEILEGAETAAEKNWAESSAVSNTLHERYKKLLETLDGHADALKLEHEEALASTKAEVEKMTTDAAHRREELDAEAETKRRKIEEEFQERLAAERRALDDHVTEEKATSRREAEERVDEAKHEAKRLVDEATEKARELVESATAEADRRTSEANDVVSRLTTIREEARTRLQEADRMLEQGESALIPPQDEESTPSESPGTTS